MNNNVGVYKDGININRFISSWDPNESTSRENLFRSQENFEKPLIEDVQKLLNSPHKEGDDHSNSMTQSIQENFTSLCSSMKTLPTEKKGNFDDLLGDRILSVMAGKSEGPNEEKEQKPTLADIKDKV